LEKTYKKLSKVYVLFIPMYMGYHHSTAAAICGAVVVASLITVSLYL